MGCKVFQQDGKIGFICSDIGGYVDAENEWWEANKKEEIKEYKESFIARIIEVSKADRDTAIYELDAHIESTGYYDLTWECPEDDADECMSYWSE